MRRKAKRKYFTKAQKKHRDVLLNGFLKGELLFIRNTGIKVKLEQFSEDNMFKDMQYRFHTMVRTLDPPTVECLEKFNDYRLSDVHLNNNKFSIQATGSISILELSLNPFDTIAGKTLYGK